MTELFARATKLSTEKQSILIFRMRELIFAAREKDRPLVPLPADGMEAAPYAVGLTKAVPPPLDHLPLSALREDVGELPSHEDLAAMPDDEVTRLLTTVLSETLDEQQGRQPQNQALQDENIDINELNPDQLDSLSDEQVTLLLGDLLAQEATTSDQVDEISAMSDQSDDAAGLSDERVDELLVKRLTEESGPEASDQVAETGPGPLDSSALSDDAVKELLTRLASENEEDFRVMLLEVTNHAGGDSIDDRRLRAKAGVGMPGDGIYLKRGNR
ncbi:MAG: hypothetical protein QNK37_15935 [Acidobacteriota bacterium]|nr:hypothetical protein [Acidobacteriota bacterium]